MDRFETSFNELIETNNRLLETAIELCKTIAKFSETPSLIEGMNKRLEIIAEAL